MKKHEWMKKKVKEKEEENRGKVNEKKKYWMNGNDEPKEKKKTSKEWQKISHFITNDLDWKNNNELKRSFVWDSVKVETGEKSFD